MKLLVSGGAGYIGSVVTARLLEEGHDVTVLDDLSTGHRDAVPPEATFVEGRVHDAEDVIASGNFEAALHFAVFSLVGESVSNPGKYEENNIVGSLATLRRAAARWSREVDLLLERRGLRRAGRRPDHRERAHFAVEPLWRHQARHRPRSQPKGC